MSVSAIQQPALAPLREAEQALRTALSNWTAALSPVDAAKLGAGLTVELASPNSAAPRLALLALLQDTFRALPELQPGPLTPQADLETRTALEKSIRKHGWAIGKTLGSERQAERIDPELCSRGVSFQHLGTLKEQFAKLDALGTELSTLKEAEPGLETPEKAARSELQNASTAYQTAQSAKGWRSDGKREKAKTARDNAQTLFDAASRALRANTSRQAEIAREQTEIHRSVGSTLRHVAEPRQKLEAHRAQIHLLAQKAPEVVKLLQDGSAPSAHRAWTLIEPHYKTPESPFDTRDVPLKDLTLLFLEAEPETQETLAAPLTNAWKAAMRSGLEKPEEQLLATLEGGTFRDEANDTTLSPGLLKTEAGRTMAEALIETLVELSVEKKQLLLPRLLDRLEADAAKQVKPETLDQPFPFHPAALARLTPLHAVAEKLIRDAPLREFCKQPDARAWVKALAVDGLPVRVGGTDLKHEISLLEAIRPELDEATLAKHAQRMAASEHPDGAVVTFDSVRDQVMRAADIATWDAQPQVVVNADVSLLAGEALTRALDAYSVIPAYENRRGQRRSYVVFTQGSNGQLEALKQRLAQRTDVTVRSLDSIRGTRFSGYMGGGAMPDVLGFATHSRDLVSTEHYAKEKEPETRRSW